jgi:dual specificity tyrosine-phosphorylation-regulated kinase 2/3/4
MQNNKDYLDQSLDEIKLLKHVNETDPNDEYGMLRLFDFFYYKVGSSPNLLQKKCLG